MNEIYVVGVGMTQFGRLLERSVYDMVGEAAGAWDSGCEAGNRPALRNSTNGQPGNGYSRTDRHAAPGIEGIPGVHCRERLRAGSSASTWRPGSACR